MLNIKIEGVPYQVEEGLTILEAAMKFLRSARSITANVRKVPAACA